MANADLAIALKATDDASAVMKSFEASVGHLESSIGSLVTKVAALGGIALGFHLLQGAIGGFLADAIDSESVTAQLNSVLASTGGVAGETADDVTNLATQLSQVTPFEDELITSTASLLLTFTKIGKDVFPQATEAALNMAQALGEEPKNAAIQLGKALQDPINGATALRRVGVALTEAQQEQIKAMVAVGDAAGAQKIILAELETEFGGAARAAGTTLAGQLKILDTNIGNVKESLGGPLVDGLREATRGLNEFIEGASFGDALNGTIGALKTVIGVALNFRDALLDNADAMHGPVVAALAAVGAAITVVLIPPLWAAGAAVLAALSPAILIVGGLAVAVGAAAALIALNWDAVSSATAQFGSELGTFLSQQIDLFLAAGADIAKAMADAWQTITDTVGRAVAWVSGTWDRFRKWLADTFGEVGQAIQRAWDAAWSGISGIAGRALGWIGDRLNEWVESLKRLPVVGTYITALGNTFEFVGKQAATFGGYIKDAAGNAIQAIGSFDVGAAWSTITSGLQAVVQGGMGRFDAIGHVAGANVQRGLTDGTAEGLPDAIKRAIAGIVATGQVALAGSDLGQGLVDGLLAGLASARDQIGTVLDGITAQIARGGNDQNTYKFEDLATKAKDAVTTAITDLGKLQAATQTTIQNALQDHISAIAKSATTYGDAVDKLASDHLIAEDIQTRKDGLASLQKANNDTLQAWVTAADAGFEHNRTVAKMTADYIANLARTTVDANRAVADSIASMLDAQRIQAGIEAAKSGLADLQAAARQRFDAQQSDEEAAYQHSQSLAALQRTLYASVGPAATPAQVAQAQATYDAGLKALKQSEDDAAQSRSHRQAMAAELAEFERKQQAETAALNARLQQEANDRAIAGYRAQANAQIAEVTRAFRDQQNQLKLSEQDAVNTAEHQRIITAATAAAADEARRQSAALERTLRDEADARAIAGYAAQRDAAILAAERTYTDTVEKAKAAEKEKTDAIIAALDKQLAAVAQTYAREKDLGKDLATSIQGYIDGIRTSIDLTVRTNGVASSGQVASSGGTVVNVQLYGDVYGMDDFNAKVAQAADAGIRSGSIRLTQR